MKLDEKSFNLKEEEIKGGIGSALQYGVSKVAKLSAKVIKADINEKIPNGIIDDGASLIEIKKKPNFARGNSDAFIKFNKLFGSDETGESLHFFKARFFKTDKNTIYTYSEHRNPMELVDDFSEYYGIELNKQRNTYLKNEKYSDGMTAANNFMKFINILYIFRDHTNANGKLFITYLDEKKSNLNSKEEKILFTTIESLKDYDISKIILDNNEINPYKILKLIEEIKLLLDKFISSINFTEEVEDNIIKLSEEYINVISQPDSDIQINTYKNTLYFKLSKNFKTYLDNLNVDEKISEEEKTIKLFNKKSQLKELYSKPADSTKLAESMTTNVKAEEERKREREREEQIEREIEREREERERTKEIMNERVQRARDRKIERDRAEERERDIERERGREPDYGGDGLDRETREALRADRFRGSGNNTKELRKKLNTMSIKQLKRLSDKNHIKYGKKNTIKSLINNYMKHI